VADLSVGQNSKFSLQTGLAKVRHLQDRWPV